MLGIWGILNSIHALKQQQDETQTSFSIVFKVMRIRSPGLNIVCHSGSMFFLYFVLFPSLANDLMIVISYIGITLLVLSIQNFLVIVLTSKLKA